MKNIMGIILITLMVLLTGCAQTKQTRKVETSGFLGDYSMLQKGKAGEALLLYLNPNADWASYDKLLFESVNIWHGEDSKMDDIPKSDLQLLANYLHTAIVSKLRTDYEIVNEPGPDVLRLRMAITEAEKSKDVLDVFLTIEQQDLHLSGDKVMTVDASSVVGRVGIEGEITDARNGEMLAAAVDNRSGSKSDLKASWNDVEQAFQYWAERLNLRLRELRAK